MNIQLLLDGVEIPLTMGSYKESPKTSETRNETEAGTIHRDIVRSGRKHLEVNTTVNGEEKAYLDTCAEAASLTAEFFDEGEGETVEATMFIDSYNADLIMENSEDRFYKVSFVLEEF